ncbi:hypothetical protein L6164_036748 [Bauhinia variegata]|uniref:Uncharacterized protein n=1 Tax=Bauhinia variegata TaxID=167791 RepID=A0ACB9KI68_BAUVA|nr:hypothetical protein L6164_036748 [Bauhinia variegata]
MLQWILHDWNDEQCVQILKNCRGPITDECKRGKVIIIEMATDAKSDDCELAELKLFFELNMMAKYSGKERSEKECAKLFSEADIWHFFRSWFRDNSEANLFEFAYGKGFWEFLNENPQHISAFHGIMMADSQMSKLGLRNCKSGFENLGFIIDDGGGTGTVAKIISQEFPNLKCTVLDPAKVIAGLSESKNVCYIGGDMFQSISPADAILLKHMESFNEGMACDSQMIKIALKDCNGVFKGLDSIVDVGGGTGSSNLSFVGGSMFEYIPSADAVLLKILKKCKEAISSGSNGGKVIVIDIVINEKKDDHAVTEVKLLFNINMMAILNGKERSEKEWDKLFFDAGFKSYKITSIFGFRSLIEAYS